MARAGFVVYTLDFVRHHIASSSNSTFILPLSISRRRRIKSTGRSVRAGFHAAGEQTQVVRTDVFGAGKGAEVAHHALVEGQRSRAEIARYHLRHAVFHFQTFGAGAIAAAAMTAVLRFGEGFGGIVQPVPAVVRPRLTS